MPWLAGVGHIVHLKSTPSLPIASCSVYHLAWPSTKPMLPPPLWRAGMKRLTW